MKKGEAPLLVVGGGPAGMMAAIRAAQLGARVTLIDKNRMPGRKLLLSGKGRCNLTNACSLEAFLPRFSRSGVFLRDAFKKFFNRDLMEFFEKRGLGMKIERQERVFPESDSSASIVEVLKKELHAQGVALLMGIAVTQVRVEQNAVAGVTLDTGEFIRAHRVILATGGVTYSFTGSTVQSWKIAEQLGHTLIPARGGLVPLRCAESFIKDLEGLTLKNIRLRFVSASKKIDTGIGELLFTRRGISGPLVLTASGQIVDWLRAKAQPAAVIDLKPALTEQKLDERFCRELSCAGRKSMKNILRELVPARMIPVIIRLCGIDPQATASHLSKEQRRKLVSLLKHFTLTVTASEPLDEAMVTRGGISLKEIDPRTMQSRLVKGLYCAGELIDVDADTGGFNLQAAFSTGYLAGESAAMSV